MVVECEAAAEEEQQVEEARGEGPGIGRCGVVEAAEAGLRHRVAIGGAHCRRRSSSNGDVGGSSRGDWMVWDMPSGLLAHEALTAWGTLAAVLAAGLSISWAAASRALIRAQRCSTRVRAH